MFITKEDLITKIRTYRLNQIIDEDDTILEMAFTDTVAQIENYLHQFYDTDQIFAATLDERSPVVLLWAKQIALYLIYERIPDELLPPRVEKNYDDTIAILEKIAEGRVSVKLPRKIKEDGKPATKFRWGSVQARSH
jgi:phage gp36-like protein